MERIPPYKEGSEWAVYRDHFYFLKQKKGTSQYFYCAKPGCLAHVIDKGQIVGERRHHNHEPDAWIPERNQFYQELKRRSMTESVSLREIYDSEAQRLPVGALHLPYPESTMRKWRRSVTPAIPDTLEEYGQVLRAQARPAYLTTVTNDGGGVIAGGWGYRRWGCGHICYEKDRNIAAANTLLMDGTFKTVPAAPAAAQLLTLHTIVEGRAYNPVLAIMSNRSTSLYETVFEELKRRAAFGHIATIITDYETSLLLATSRCFPGAAQKGCFFHFAQSIVRRARQNRAINIFSNASQRILRLIKCLALLPAEKIPEGLAFVRTCAEDMPEFDPLFQYFQQYWMVRIGPGVFSVHGEPNRTNNISEIFHSRLGRRFGAIPHPSIWRFTDMIQSILECSGLDFERSVAGHPVPATRAAVKLLLQNRRLRADEGLLEGGVISIGEFLNRMAGNIDYPVLYNEADVPIELEIEVPPPPPPTPPPPPAVPEVNRPTCVACLVDRACIVLVPCGHLCMCYACSTRIVERCPVCRVMIQLSQRVFMPLELGNV